MSSSCSRWCTRCARSTLPAGGWGSAARGLLVRLRPADGQPGDHVAQDEPASKQDVRPLARRDRGLPLRRDAPARRTQPDGSAVAPWLRRRRRPRDIDRRIRRGESAGALPPRPRRSHPSCARSSPRQVGDNPARDGSRVRKRPTHTTPHAGGGEGNPPRCWYVHRARRRGASALYRHNCCPIAADALGRPLSLTVVRPGTVEGARRRRALQADHARCGGGLVYARRLAQSAPR